MITDTLKNLIYEAMKTHDEVRLSTLKLLSASLTRAEIEKKRQKLTREEEYEVVRREAKKRKDTIQIYENVSDKQNVSDKLEREKEELKILEQFLPPEIGDDELENIIRNEINLMGASGISDMGKVMGIVMPKLKGKADGGRVSEMVKKLLTE